MNKLTVIITALLFCAAFSNCKKSDSGMPAAPAPKDTTLFVTLQDNGTTAEQIVYSYDAAGRLSRFTDTSWSDATPNQKRFDASHDLTWGTNSRIFNQLAAHLPGSDYTLTYGPVATHQLVKRMNIANPPPNLVNIEEWLGIDAAGRIIADTTYDATHGSIKGYTLFYYDNNDNLTHFVVFAADPNNGGAFIGSSVYSYTYDQKKNPLYKLGSTILPLGAVAFNYPQLSRNNMLSETGTINATGTTMVTTTYAYEYNSDGLPTRRTSVSTIPSVNGITITYKYTKP